MGLARDRPVKPGEYRDDIRDHLRRRGQKDKNRIKMAASVQLDPKPGAPVGLSRDFGPPRRLNSPPPPFTLPPIPQWYPGGLQRAGPTSVPQAAWPARNETDLQSGSRDPAPVYYSLPQHFRHVEAPRSDTPPTPSPVRFIANAGRKAVPEKSTRQNLPPEAVRILKAWFHAHRGSPYPRDDEKQWLQEQTKMTPTQVANWFINARRRYLPRLLREQAAAEEIQNRFT